ncbi:P-loop containing nucleoside triphosphate hydrolase protein [Microdochium trichocladiopsis]|uniref:P-loop containing nucleoside triphosphate hydrolase protein n=1 Tax=Microdochium trichocladiopsis TaxID=1682393 RepID=A0A9P8XRR7_9PEZI|nr:P-loop containing nucleoside triphosphate hydrolase protein [Microdochium trichocladiopsis]KAH7014214.1 P-loop containing nucleoside triphosphate hydrolase protein [Microdochium trichocladiopsis]
MGQEYSAPRPGTKLRVIGAGLPRTGTASFTKALSMLLDGPVYHTGTQSTLGPEREVKTLIEMLRLIKTDIDPADRAKALALMKGQLDGYAAVTDAPYCSLAPELLELYPDAIVICTTRDVDGWTRSMSGIASTATQGFLRFSLYLLPSMRWFPDYIDALIVYYGVLTGLPTPEAWARHVEKLKRSVPPEKLFFYDVRDGWEPLCNILGVEVPEGVEFPRINDGKALDAFAKKQIRTGLLRWVVVFGSVAAAVGAAVMARG